MEITPALKSAAKVIVLNPVGVVGNLRIWRPRGALPIGKVLVAPVRYACRYIVLGHVLNRIKSNYGIICTQPFLSPFSETFYPL